MAHKVEVMRSSRVRRSLAILLCCVGISGCANLGWNDLEPHYTSDSSPAKTTWRELNPWLYSIFGTSDGRSLWGVGFNGTILHSADGEHWSAQTSGTRISFPRFSGTATAGRCGPWALVGRFCTAPTVSTGPLRPAAPRMTFAQST